MSCFGSRIRHAKPTQEDVPNRRWVYVPYDCLTDAVGPLSEQPASETVAVFVESREKANRRPYHKKKLTVLLANERHFALELASRGVKVLYLAGEDSISSQISSACHELGIQQIVTTTPAERELRVDLSRSRVRIEYVPDVTWLTQQSEFAGVSIMDTFYRRVRRRSGILMDGARPTGGKWSYDAENRKPYRPDRGAPPIPERPSYPPDEITLEVMELVERYFPKHFGSTAGFDLPTTVDDCQHYWRVALEQLLPLFGPYEDAMRSDAPDLFHSRISALLNLSRLLPSQVVQDVEDHYREGRIPLASAEGFIRQILGWREYMHWLHVSTDGFRNLPVFYEPSPKPENSPSFLHATKPLPKAYWGSPSGMNCLDTVVRQVIEEGWSHHITRLMVLSNLATLAGFSPRELTDWFWFAYVDAYDWVVEPNVLGMATYADGGLTATKPYVSGAAYINRMSNYCGGCRYDPKKSLGEDACPFTAMYWSFLDEHRDLLADNPRLKMPYVTLARKSASELRALKAYASEKIEELLAVPRAEY